jgi:hypothetical protein
VTLEFVAGFVYEQTLRELYRLVVARSDLTAAVGATPPYTELWLSCKMLFESLTRDRSLRTGHMVVSPNPNERPFPLGVSKCFTRTIMELGTRPYRIVMLTSAIVLLCHLVSSSRLWRADSRVAAQPRIDTNDDPPWVRQEPPSGQLPDTSAGFGVNLPRCDKIFRSRAAAPPGLGLRF